MFITQHAPQMHQVLPLDTGIGIFLVRPARAKLDLPAVVTIDELRAFAGINTEQRNQGTSAALHGQTVYYCHYLHQG